MSHDWAHLAAAVRQGRQRRRMTQQELAIAAGVSESTIQNLEDGTRSYRRIPPSLPSIEAALGWTPGSTDTVLAGGDPTYAEDAPPPPRSPHTGGRAFADDRFQAIWELDLPLEEKERAIRSMMEGDLRRAKARGGAREEDRRTG